MNIRLQLIIIMELHIQLIIQLVNHGILIPNFTMQNTKQQIVESMKSAESCLDLAS